MVISSVSALERVREISSEAKAVYSKRVSVQVPAMLRTLSESMHHSDTRVRSAAVGAFSELSSKYKNEIQDSDLLGSFESIRDDKSIFKYDQDSAQLLSDTLSNVFGCEEEGPDYVSDDYLVSTKPGNKTLGMIIRLVPNKANSHASVYQINIGVVQMRMVLVAGVISASVRLEDNDSAEEGAETSKIAKVFLSVKMAQDDPEKEVFVAELNAAVVDGTEGRFKLGSVDFWEKEKKSSGKSSPVMEKSTDFAESEIDDGMYLDDDEKLAGRATGKKKTKPLPVMAKRPFSMFNPNSALGLNSVFNGGGMLEMVEYDPHEAAAQKAAASAKPPAQPAAPVASGFGLFRRFFG